MSSTSEDDEKDRFCIYCGIWFDDYKIYCPNCNQTKVPTAATRTRISENSLKNLINKIKRELKFDT